MLNKFSILFDGVWRKKRIFTISICLLLIADLLSLANVVSILPLIAWVIVVFPLGGSLLTGLIFGRTKLLGTAERIVYCVGFGLFILIFTGLMLNSLGSLLNHALLTKGYALIGLNTAIIGCIFLALGTNRYYIPKINLKPIYSLEGLLTIFPFLFPLISIAGVERLNNGASGMLAIANVLLMIAFIVMRLWLYKPKSDYAYSVLLFSIGFALLLSVSMRSNYLIGADIHSEYKVFMETLNSGAWHPSTIDSAYNACLSITILPTIISLITHMSPEFVFKFVMQAVLPFVAIVVFILARRQLGGKTRLAFMAALFFVVQSQFMFEFSSLIRQQVAMLFFSLVFLAATTAWLSRGVKSVLILMFGVSMIVSHYSTAYIFFALLLIAVVIELLIKVGHRLSGREYVVGNANGVSISKSNILILILFGFLWFGQATHATGGPLRAITTSFSDMGQFFSSNSRSSFVISTFGGSRSYDTETLSKLSQSRHVGDSYPSSIVNQYTLIPERPIAPSPQSSKGQLLLYAFNKIIPLMVKIVFVVGVIVLVVGGITGRLNISDISLAVSASSLFLLFVLLPSLSQSYNIERLYQQLLVVIPAAIILGVTALTKNSKKLVYVSTVSLIIVCFFCTSGLANQLFFNVGGINYDNYSVMYEAFYTTDANVRALMWPPLVTSTQPVNFDHYSILQARAYSSLTYGRIREGILPSEIPKSGYVYASRSNVVDGITFEPYLDQQVSLNFPSDFLGNTKNIVYANNTTKLYK